MACCASEVRDRVGELSTGRNLWSLGGKPGKSERLNAVLYIR